MDVSVDEVYECRFIGDHDGQAVVNILHGIVTSIQGATATAPLQAAADLVRDAYINNVVPELHDAYAFHQLRMLRVSGGLEVPQPPPSPPRYHLTYDAEAESVPSAPVFGSIIGDPLPTYVAINVRKKASIGGSIRSGGMRVGPLVETDIGDQTSGNLLSGGGLVKGGNVAAWLLTQVALEATQEWFLNWGVASRKDIAFPGTPVKDGFGILTGSVVNPLVSSQVSRKRVRTFA